MVNSVPTGPMMGVKSNGPSVGPTGQFGDWLPLPVTVNRSPELIAEAPFDVVTTTSYTPDGREGDVAVIEVEETIFTLVAALPPKRTIAPETKFVPPMVTFVWLLLPEQAEEVDTVFGETDVTEGDMDDV
jgi:hypothetical protein